MAQEPLFREMAKELMAQMNYHVGFKINLENYIASLQPEFEIVAYKRPDGLIFEKNKNRDHWSPIEDSTANIIHSVRYKGEVFTVGDWVRYFRSFHGDNKMFDFKIEKIILSGGKQLLLSDGVDNTCIIDVAHKLSPIFVTNGDNEPMFDPKETYYFFDIKNPHGVFSSAAQSYVDDPGLMRFKSKEKAKDWLFEKATVFSLMDYIQYRNSPYDEVEKVVRERLGL